MKIKETYKKTHIRNSLSDNDLQTCEPIKHLKY